MIREINLTRHAPLANVAGRVYGYDAQLDDTTPREAFEAAASQLAPGGAIWVASDYPRAIRTAGRLCRIVNPDLVRVPGWLTTETLLGEQGFGTWVGQSQEALRAKDPVFRNVTAHVFGWEEMAPPMGESFNRLVVRVGRGLEKLASMARRGSVNAVAHGGTLRAALVIAGGATPDQAVNTRVPHLAVLKLGYDDAKPESSRWNVLTGPQ